MNGKGVWKRFELKKRSRMIQKHARRVEGVTARHAHRFLISRWDNIREVRAHIIFWMSGVGVLVALVGLQMVWFQQSYVTHAAISGGTYAEAVKGPINTLNPLFASTPAELSASHLLFSSLYMNDVTGHIKGDVATSMTNENDKVFTVNMRHDVRWQDGQPLTADDVIFTVNLMKNSSVRSVMSASWQSITATKVDNYSVQFTLPASYAAFPEALTFSILPQHLLKSIDPSSLREANYSTAPIGSGPFKLRLLQTVSDTTGQEIVHMDANDDYYNGRPRLDHLQLDAYNDDASIGMALKTGEVTGASDVSSDVASTLDKSRYDTIIRPVDNGVYAIFNTANDILKDPIVRQALQIGTNTAAIRQKIYGHPQQLSLPFIGSEIIGANSVLTPRYDFNAAGKALDADGWIMHAGVRMKGSEKLDLRIVTPKNADYEAALQELVTQWHKLGVQVETQIFDTTDPSQNFSTDILQQHNYDVLLDQLVIGGDPDVFAYWDSKGLLNFSNYSNQTSDDALSSARTTSNLNLRSVKYIAFAKQWLADAPAIGLYQSNYIYVDSKSTHAVQPDQMIVSGDDHYANVLDWTANEGSVFKTP